MPVNCTNELEQILYDSSTDNSQQQKWLQQGNRSHLYSLQKKYKDDMELGMVKAGQEQNGTQPEIHARKLNEMTEMNEKQRFSVDETKNLGSQQMDLARKQNFTAWNQELEGWGPNVSDREKNSSQHSGQPDVTSGRLESIGLPNRDFLDQQRNSLVQILEGTHPNSLVKKITGNYADITLPRASSSAGGVHLHTGSHIHHNNVKSRQTLSNPHKNFNFSSQIGSAVENLNEIPENREVFGSYFGSEQNSKHIPHRGEQISKNSSNAKFSDLKKVSNSETIQQISQHNTPKNYHDTIFAGTQDWFLDEFAGCEPGPGTHKCSHTAKVLWPFAPRQAHTTSHTVHTNAPLKQTMVPTGEPQLQTKQTVPDDTTSRERAMRTFPESPRRMMEAFTVQAKTTPLFELPISTAPFDPKQMNRYQMPIQNLKGFSHFQLEKSHVPENSSSFQNTLKTAEQKEVFKIQFCSGIHFYPC